MKAPEQIRAWLAREGRKQTWLAAQVPVTPQTLSAWLAGSYVPSAPSRRRLVDITGLADVDAVCAWSNTPLDLGG